MFCDQAKDRKMNTRNRMITNPGYSLRSIVLGMGLLLSPYTGMAQPAGRYGTIENIIMGFSPPEVQWQKTFGVGSSVGFSVQQTTDGERWIGASSRIQCGPGRYLGETSGPH